MEVAALSVLYGIPPSDLMAPDAHHPDDVLEAVLDQIALLQERRELNAGR